MAKQQSASWAYWLRIAGLLAGFAFMAWLLWQLLRDPALLKNHFSLRGVAEAIIIGAIGNLVVGVTFGDIVAKFSPSISFQRRISAYYYSQIAKYIPGQIAALLVQRSILAGPHASIATLMSNLELMIISCWLCSSAAIVLLMHTTTDLGAAILAIVTLSTGAWLIRKDWRPWINLLIRLIPKYRALESAPSEVDRIPWLRAIFLSAGIFILPILSSYVLVDRGISADHTMVIPLTALLILSWAIGVFAFIFPAGIGIRELIFFGLGNMLASAPGAVLMAEVALASRLVHVLVDVFGVASFLAIEQAYMHTTGVRSRRGRPD